MLGNQVKGRNNVYDRLLIVENVSKNIVETLGSLLNIDPFFFRISHRYLRSGCNKDETSDGNFTIYKEVSKLSRPSLSPCDCLRAFTIGTKNASRYKRAAKGEDNCTI